MTAKGIPKSDPAGRSRSQGQAADSAETCKRIFSKDRQEWCVSQLVSPLSASQKGRSMKFISAFALALLMAGTASAGQLSVQTVGFFSHGHDSSCAPSCAAPCAPSCAAPSAPSCAAPCAPSCAAPCDTCSSAPACDGCQLEEMSMFDKVMDIERRKNKWLLGLIGR